LGVARGIKPRSFISDRKKPNKYSIKIYLEAKAKVALEYDKFLFLRLV
jgi:hypothetical protein